jgi:uncharacterized membrane protein YgcG
MFFTQLFNYWGVGDPVRNNGLVVGMVVDKRRLEMVTGTGLQKYWPDEEVKELQEEVKGTVPVQCNTVHM